MSTEIGRATAQEASCARADAGIGYTVGGFLGTLALAGAAYAIFMR